MTPQELKASILQLAIQGKLVEQRPEEGTGEELLRDILTQRSRVAESAEKKLTHIPRAERVCEADALAGVRPPYRVLQLPLSRSVLCIFCRVYPAAASYTARGFDFPCTEARPRLYGSATSTVRGFEFDCTRVRV